MEAKYKAIDLAKAVIQLTYENGLYINHLQLHKILYYIQGAYMKQFQCKAFEDDIECWGYGPVIHEVWKIYSYYGRDPIIVYGTEAALDMLPSQERALIIDILKEKLSMDKWDLVDETRREYPWSHANECKCKIIQDKDMEYQFCE